MGNRLDASRIETRLIPIDAIEDHSENYNRHTDEQVAGLAASHAEFGQYRSIVVWEQPGGKFIRVAGHGYSEGARREGETHLRCDVLPVDTSPETIKAIMVADNLHALKSSPDDTALAHLLQEQQDAGFNLAALGTDGETLRQMLEALGDEMMPADDEGAQEEEPPAKNATLADRFIVPPFSVLDARQGYWQERKRAWIALGIQSEIGRGEQLTLTSDEVTTEGLHYYRHRNPSYKSSSTPAQSGAQLSHATRNAGQGFGHTPGRDEKLLGGSAMDGSWVKGEDFTGLGANSNGTSIFDPVLCEVAYRWFCPPGGTVLDPFAGGSVRGVLAAMTGRQYIGVDLRPEQVEANQQQWAAMRASPTPADLVPLKVSAASARLLFHGCSPDYIRDVCHARCCESSSSPTGTLITIHPRETHKVTQHGATVVDGLLQPRQGEKKCPFKTEANLCGLHFTPDKPFGCIASPFTLHASGDTLIVRNRYKMLVCYNNDPKDGVPIPAYKAFRASLDLLFGSAEAARVCAHLDSGGGDITAYVTRSTYEMLRENDSIKKGKVPTSVDASGYGNKKSAYPDPRWIVGDSRNLPALLPDASGVDLVFTCPPYYNLETYSSDPQDLSTLDSYEEFLSVYRDILAKAIGKLKDNRFVCLVVGDIRDKRGFYCNFVSDTIQACEDAGARLYNEAILVTQAGSLPIRVGKQFARSRKLGKTHQNVLVFCKGDPVQAVRDCGPVEVLVPDEEGEEVLEDASEEEE